MEKTILISQVVSHFRNLKYEIRLEVSAIAVHLDALYGHMVRGETGTGGFATRVCAIVDWSGLLSGRG